MEKIKLIQPVVVWKEILAQRLKKEDVPVMLTVM